jgi:hypothetical protein
VSEVDGDGRLVRVYGQVRGNGGQQLDWPHHLSLDAAGHVFVADTNNHRVLLLNTQLQLEHVLLSEDLDELSNPVHLWHLEADTSQLLVVGKCSDRCVVNLYSLH